LLVESVDNFVFSVVFLAAGQQKERHLNFILKNDNILKQTMKYREFLQNM